MKHIKINLNRSAFTGRCRCGCILNIKNPISLLSAMGVPIIKVCKYHLSDFRNHKYLDIYDFNRIKKQNFFEFASDLKS